MVTLITGKHMLLIRGAAIVVVLGLWPAVLHAQEPVLPQNLTNEELRTEITRLKTEMDTLIASPDAPPEWQEALAAQKELEQRRKLFYQQEQALRERILPKVQTPEMDAWRRRVDQAQGRYSELTNEEARRVRLAGYETHTARHKELLDLPPADTPKLRELGFDVLTFPRMDGSTSTQPLATLIASRCFRVRCEWLGKAQQWSHERWGMNDGGLLGLAVPREAEYELAEFTMKAMPDEGVTRRLAPIVNGLLAANASTHDAYVNLIEGRSDIGLLARGPSPDELDLARKSSVELETVPVALDAFVFIVHEANPVRNLTTAQIRDIYSGRIVNWKDLGGPEEPIVPYQREPNSGSQELMIALVMKDLPFTSQGGPLSAPKLISYGMGGPFLALTRDTNGLAYSVYYYEHYMAASPRTRPIAVDGVEPTFDTIQNRSYPYATEVLAVTRKGLAPDAPALRLRDWMRSPEGQALVRKSGYVPIAPGT